MQANFKRVHTAEDLIVSSFLVVVGVGLFFANKGLGVFFIACGLLSAIFYKKGYVKLPQARSDTGRPLCLRRKSLELDKRCRSSVLDFLSGLSDNVELSQTGAGGSVLLEVWYNRKASLAYVQLYDFRDCAYEKASEVVKLEGERASGLISRL